MKRLQRERKIKKKCRRTRAPAYGAEKRAEEKQKQDELAVAARKRKITIAAGIIAAVIMVILLVTKVIMPAANYSKAEKLLAAGDYDGAIAAFAASGDYKDAENAKAHAHAEQLQKNGETAKAAIASENWAIIGSSSERSQVLWDVVAVQDTVMQGGAHPVGLKSNGTVLAVREIMMMVRAMSVTGQTSAVKRVNRKGEKRWHAGSLGSNWCDR